jgi:hypothetical protein
MEKQERTGVCKVSDFLRATIKVFSQEEHFLSHEYSLEMLASAYKSTQCHTVEDDNLNKGCREKLQIYVNSLITVSNN